MSNPTPKYTSLPQPFDSSGIAPALPFEALPVGWYNVCITDGEVKAIENGLRMELEFTVLDGAFKDRKVFDGFNYEHRTSAKAQEIAQQQISAICHATGVIRFQDVQELFNKPFQLQAGTEPGRWVNGRNEEVEVPPGTPPGTPPPGALKYYEAKNRFRGAKAGTGAAVAGVAGGIAPPAWAVAPKAPGAVATAAPAIVVVPPVAPPWIQPGAAAPAAPAPVVPAAVVPAAPPAAIVDKKPKGPKAKAAKERTFFVLMPDGEVSDAKAESEVVAMLAQGMPLETQINPGTEDEGWKTAGEYGLAPETHAVVAAAPGAAAPPPWARK